MIVAAIVLWSAFYVFKHVFPKTFFKVKTGLANICRRQGYDKLAQKIQPVAVGGCGGGCGCSASESKQPDAVQAVKWK